MSTISQNTHAFEWLFAVVLTLNFDNVFFTNIFSSSCSFLCNAFWSSTDLVFSLLLVVLVMILLPFPSHLSLTHPPRTALPVLGAAPK